MSELYSTVKPYEGSEDYIFISYSHRDTQRVFPLLQRLQDNGFRLWFDEGIDPGTEWPESIAAHLASSKVCLAFLSPSSVESTNCRREINFALSRGKDFLSIALEPVEMSPGLELQISTYQSLLSYRYPSREAFEQRLFSLELLQSCREAPSAPIPTPAPEPAPAVLPTPAPAPVSVTAPASAPTPAAVSAAKSAPVSAPAPSDRAMPDPAPAPIPAKPAKQEKKPAKKAKWLLLLLIPVALILGLVLLLTNPFAKTVRIGEQKLKNQSYVSLRNAALSEKDVKSLNKLDKCKSIALTGCTFEAGALTGLDMPQLTALSLTDCSGVSDLGAVSSMKGLTALILNGCDITDSVLDGAVLPPTITKLELDDCSVSRIPELPALTLLHMKGCQVSDLTVLSRCVGLTDLDLRENRITSLTGLENCKKLKNLLLGGNQIEDLSILEPFVYLEKLDLSGNPISSVAPLSHCSLFKEVSLGGCTKIHDVSFLAPSAGSLTKLDLCGLEGVDLSFLPSCSLMKELSVNSCGLKDLSCVKGLVELTVLNAADNQIRELSPLRELGKLSILNLADNRIESLQGMPAPLVAEGQKAPQINLLLHGNMLTTLEGLETGWTYRLLTLTGNPLTDLSALDGATGYNVTLDMSKDLDPQSLKVFNAVYVQEPVLDCQTTWEKTLAGKLKYLPFPETLANLKKSLNLSKLILPD